MLYIDYKMNRRQTQVSNRIYADSCISWCTEEINEIVSSVDKTYYCRISRNIGCLAAIEADNIMTLLRGEIPTGLNPSEVWHSEHDYNPRKDWALFTSFNYCDPDAFTSYEERNKMNVAQLEKEIYRDLLVDFIFMFEKLEDCPFLEDHEVHDEILTYLYIYRGLRTKYETYLGSVRNFCLIRNTSRRYVANSRLIGTSEKGMVSKVASLGSNPMRRALEYVY